MRRWLAARAFAPRAAISFSLTPRESTWCDGSWRPEPVCQGQGVVMLVFQVALLSFGVVAGLLLAWLLPRIPMTGDARARNAIAFGAGAAAFIFFAAITFAPPMSWVLMGTVLALYVPSLIVIVGSASAGSQDSSGTAS